MDYISLPDAFEPAEWFVVFHTRASTWWLSWIALGRFKHVSAFAYIPGFKAWLVYDVGLTGVRLLLLAHPGGLPALTAYTKDHVVVRVRQIPRGRKVLLRPLICTSAIAHLLGITGVAMLRPDALYRRILRSGGVPIGRHQSGRSDLAGAHDPRNIVGGADGGGHAGPIVAA
jgi:hypothetical protein